MQSLRLRLAAGGHADVGAAALGFCQEADITATGAAHATMPMPTLPALHCCSVPGGGVDASLSAHINLSSFITPVVSQAS
jgi:hypothetical protein